jgi:hypothetical protein
VNQEYEIIKPLESIKGVLIFCSVFSFGLWIGAIIATVAKNYNDALFLSIFAAMWLLTLPLLLWNHEWWLINEEEIIVRNIFRIKNRITYDDINMIKTIEVHYAGGFYPLCYIINDTKNRVKAMRGKAYNYQKKLFIIPVTDISKKYLDKYMDNKK